MRYRAAKTVKVILAALKIFIGRKAISKLGFEASGDASHPYA